MAITSLIDWTAILTVTSVYAVAVVSPGPNVITVIHAAVASKRGQALAVAAGIVTVNVLWATAAVLGVSLVFAAFPWLALGAKVGGALYLMWFGLRLLAGARAEVPSVRESAARSIRAGYARGVLTNITNPKSVAFFATIFASASPAHVNMPTLAVMLLVVLVISGTWYSSVALVLSHARLAAGYRRQKAWIDRACGTAIIALGLRQLVRT